MSDNQPKTKQEIEAHLKARLEAQQEAAREAQYKHQALVDSYHHNKADEVKADRAQVEASAAAERKQTLDPLELIRQVQIMREEGVDDATIRAAFNEIMDSMTGNARRPLRRITKSEGMTKMPTQEEINKMYFDRYKDVEESDDVHPDVNLLIEEVRRAGARRRYLETSRLGKVRMYAYRAAYAILKYPLKGLIYLCKVLGV